ncbi:GIY-YIG nuclease family protein [Anaerobacillus sp. CMMVII]|uniref:GIY-YIG nuclease family protein n=1 Tax=Anaerobacillus sp. CMMVII TaxID=2755588 RepID=UPI0021B76B2F|nr:GIY-YIG nuclease family protein [Anaerobacillus sp. CMMVII]MCT8136706.1 GIY-YIG nuclease family protein [Anaerobacillus sp. CMMVII]
MKPVNYDLNDTLYAIKAVMTEDKPEITIGKLGTFSFQKGFYVYVGSAKRNIQHRINRHIRIEKKQRWHFDYLRPFVEVLEVETFPGNEGECLLFQRLMKESRGSTPVKGFGSSDCRCTSHLFYTAVQL